MDRDRDDERARSVEREAQQREREVERENDARVRDAVRNEKRAAKSEQRAEFLRELDVRIARHLEDPKSVVAPHLREFGDFREGLGRMDPFTRWDNREQLIAEILHKHVLSNSGYREVSGGKVESWGGLDAGERLSLLRNADLVTAHIEGRTPCVLVRSIGDYQGEYRSLGHVILFSESQTLAPPVKELDAITTLFHEQRHRLQFDCIWDPASHPEISESQWRGWLAQALADEYMGMDRPRTAQDFLVYMDRTTEVDARSDAAQRAQRIHELRRNQQD